MNGLATWLLLGPVRNIKAVPGVFVLLTAVGLWLIFIGCYRQWGMRKRGSNPSTGQTWQCTTLFGIELDWSWHSGFYPVTWPGSPARIIRYPASVAEFCRQGNGVDIVSTAMLQLFAQGILSLGKQQTQRRFGRQQVGWLVLPGNSFDTADPLGALESRMVEIFVAADQPVMLLEDFLDALFEGGQPQPRNYLIDRYVGPEAVGLGLGKVIGVRQRSLAPAPTASAKIGRDIQSVEQLYRDLWTSSPEEAADLLFQLDRQVIRLMRKGTSSLR
jgi:hypothetical protein